jgi:hypothetical protein
MEQKVLLIALNGLDIMPALGETFAINGIDYAVVQVKHNLNTSSMSHSLDFYLMKPSMAYELEGEYIEER